MNVKQTKTTTTNPNPSIVFLSSLHTIKITKHTVIIYFYYIELIKKIKNIILSVGKRDKYILELL